LRKLRAFPYSEYKKLCFEAIAQYSSFIFLGDETFRKGWMSYFSKRPKCSRIATIPLGCEDAKNRGGSSPAKFKTNLRTTKIPAGLDGVSAAGPKRWNKASETVHREQTHAADGENDFSSALLLPLGWKIGPHTMFRSAHIMGIRPTKKRPRVERRQGERPAPTTTSLGKRSCGIILDSFYK
jgi:hypothetical protein